MLIGHILHFSFNDILDSENDGKNEADSNDTLSSEEFDYFSEQAEIILKALYGVK